MDASCHSYLVGHTKEPSLLDDRPQVPGIGLDFKPLRKQYVWKIKGRKTTKENSLRTDTFAPPPIPICMLAEVMCLIWYAHVIEHLAQTRSWWKWNGLRTRSWIHATHHPTAIHLCAKYGMTKSKDKKAVALTHSHIKNPIDLEVKGQRCIRIMNIFETSFGDRPKCQIWDANVKEVKRWTGICTDRQIPMYTPP